MSSLDGPEDQDKKRRRLVLHLAKSDPLPAAARSLLAPQHSLNTSDHGKCMDENSESIVMTGGIAEKPVHDLTLESDEDDEEQVEVIESPHPRGSGIENGRETAASNPCAAETQSELKKSSKNGAEHANYSSSSGGKVGSSASLPLLPFYLGQVRGLSPEYNAQCLGLEDVFSGAFHRAIVCNYMYEWSFFLETLPRLLSIPWLCIYGDENPSTPQISEAFPNIATFKPRFRNTPFAWGTHHSKMALLLYEGGIRVMICTSNFIEVDWHNKTQGIWVQDFPKLREEDKADDSLFGRDLREYLQALNGFENECGSRGPHSPGKGHPLLTEMIEQELPRIDFSSAQAVLLASVPGKHTGHDKFKFGHLKLRRLLEKEPMPPGLFPSTPPCPSPARASSLLATGLVSQFSSLGSHARNGLWVTQDFERSLSSSSSSPPPPSTSPSTFATCLPSYLIWPRFSDVDGSLEGRAAGGALPCPPKNMFLRFPKGGGGGEGSEVHPYLKERLARWEGGRWGRQRAMPHLKSFLRFSVIREGAGAAPGENGRGQGACKETTRLAWVLITSHNYSKPAWGELQSKGEVFKIQSFEMGVLFLPSRYPRLARTFSLTPSHPLLGLGPPAQENICGFYSAGWQEARKVARREGGGGGKGGALLAFPLPYVCPPTRYDSRDEPWVSPVHHY